MKTRGSATLSGDVRVRTPADRKEVARLMRQIAKGIGAAHEVAVAVEFNTEFIETINADEPTQAVVTAARAQGLETDGNRDPMSFSEDFAHFAAAIPGCFLLLGNGETGPNAQPLHSADYDFNDALLPIGRDFWVQLARDRLPVSHANKG